MGDQNQDIQAQLRKLELECQKLALEIEQMKKQWWKKVGSWAVILPVVGAIITGGVTLTTHILSMSKEDIIRGQHLNAVKTTGTSKEIPTEEEKTELNRKENLKRLLLDSLKE